MAFHNKVYVSMDADNDLHYLARNFQHLVFCLLIEKVI